MYGLGVGSMRLAPVAKSFLLLKFARSRRLRIAWFLIFETRAALLQGWDLSHPRYYCFEDSLEMQGFVECRMFADDHKFVVATFGLGIRPKRIP